MLFNAIVKGITLQERKIEETGKTGASKIKIYQVDFRINEYIELYCNGLIKKDRRAIKIFVEERHGERIDKEVLGECIKEMNRREE